MYNKNTAFIIMIMNEKIDCYLNYKNMEIINYYQLFVMKTFN